MLTPPIPVLLPLLIAALLAALHNRISNGLASLLAVLTTAGVACVAIAMVNYSRDEPILVSAFAGFIFVIDNVSAMLVLLAATLTTAALIFSSCYFDTAGTFYHSLMLVFLGAMCGVCETGNLLNLFVFFEILSIAAFFLCRYRSDPGPSRAAWTFVVTDNAAVVLVLAGIGLLYARAHTMNLALLGRMLNRPADMLVAAAFAFLVCGFFVKSAIVPFHFWLPGAISIAPLPVCVLLGGAMVQLGLYCIVRVYWTVFSGAFATQENELRTLLAAFGAITAISGGVVAFAQRGLKRMLAFSIVSHSGIMLLGVALLSNQALAGVELYVMGNALLTGGLFLAAGIVLHRTGMLDELELAAKPHRLPLASALLMAGAIGSAAMPPFATFWGSMMIGGAAHAMRRHWMEWVSVAACALTSGAVLRFIAHALFRLGPRPATPPHPITEHPDTPAAMWVPAAGLIAIGLLAGLAPRLTGAAEAAAIYVQDRHSYAERVLDNMNPYPPTVGDQPVTTGDLARGASALGIALILAALTLRSTRTRRAAAALGRVRQLHRRLVPDYLTWIMVGVGVFGAVAVVWLRSY
jgi:multicomponent Na+:H+ antiporter subunit D